MAIELFGKYLQDGNTIVMLRDSDRTVDFNFTATLKGDHTDDTLADLIDAGLSQLKAKYFAEATILAVENKIERFEELVANSVKEVKDLKSQLKTQNEAHDALAKSFQEFVDKMKG